MAKTVHSLLSSQVQSLIRELRSHKLRYALVTQPCLTVCNPVDYSPSGFSVYGILQARILRSMAKKNPQANRKNWMVWF